MINHLKVATLLSILVLVSSPALGYTNFSGELAREGMVLVKVDGLVGSEIDINGIALTPNLVLVTKASISRVGLKLTIDGRPATLASKFGDSNLSLLSYPTGGLAPVTFANNLPEAKRNVFIVNHTDAVISGTLIDQGSVQPGLIFMSMSKALIPNTGLGVFNNCGHLLGVYDASAGGDLTAAVSLFPLAEEIDAVDGTIFTQIDCPSEVEKRQIELKKQTLETQEKQSEAAKKIKAADDALQITREKMAEQEAINEKALAEADRKAQEELANAKQDAEKKQTASEEAIAVAEAEKTKTEEALRKAENDMISAEKEQEITNKAEKKKQLLIGGSILMGLVIFVIILIIRRKKKKIKLDQLDIGDLDDLPSLGIDVFIRGNAVGVKVPAELIARVGGVVIGRSATECDFVIDAPELSRSHIRLSEKDGIIYLEDLGSANGTNLNGLKLQPAQLAALHHGDSLELAASVFSVEFKGR